MSPFFISLLSQLHQLITLRTSRKNNNIHKQYILNHFMNSFALNLRSQVVLLMPYSSWALSGEGTCAKP